MAGYSKPSIIGPTLHVLRTVAIAIHLPTLYTVYKSSSTNASRPIIALRCLTHRALFAAAAQMEG